MGAGRMTTPQSGTSEREQFSDSSPIGVVGGHMKPRLTANVLAGLATMAGLIEAGGTAEICGYDEDQIVRMKEPGRSETRATLREVDAALHWIRKMQVYRA